MLQAAEIQKQNFFIKKRSVLQFISAATSSFSPYIQGDDFSEVLVQDQHTSRRDGLFHLYRTDALQGQEEGRRELITCACSYWKEVQTQCALPSIIGYWMSLKARSFGLSSADIKIFIPFRRGTRSQYTLRNKRPEFSWKLPLTYSLCQGWGWKEAEPGCKVRRGEARMSLDSLGMGGAFGKKGEPPLEEGTWTKLKPGDWYWGLQEAD